MNYKLLILSCFIVTSFCNNKYLEEKYEQIKNEENFTKLWTSMFPNYGVYCGFDVTSQYGKKPIDDMDRYCQYHDICVTLQSQGRTSCWCNQQLYYLVSNVHPKNIKESKAKDSILYYIYIAVAGCKNYYHFATNIKITRVNSENSTKGYNYLPFYPNIYNQQSYVIKINGSSEGSAYIFKFDKKIYEKFTVNAFNNPVDALSKYNKYFVHELTNRPYQIMIDNNYYVIYNPSIEYGKTIHIINNTACGTFDVDKTKVKLEYYLLVVICVLLLMFLLGLIYITCKYWRDYERLE